MCEANQNPIRKDSFLQLGGKINMKRKHSCAKFLWFGFFILLIRLAICYFSQVSLFSTGCIAKCYEFMTYINTNKQASQVRLSSLKSFRLISINDTTVLAVVNLI